MESQKHFMYQQQQLRSLCHPVPRFHTSKYFSFARKHIRVYINENLRCMCRGQKAVLTFSSSTPASQHYVFHYDLLQTKLDDRMRGKERERGAVAKREP